MKTSSNTMSLKSKTSIALFVGLLLACAGIIAPGAVHASPGTMCLTLGAGLNQDPVTSGHLQVLGVEKLYSKGERWQHHTPLGAAIKVLPTPGMTMADLQRAAVCHAGNQDPQSPLAVEGVKIQVERQGSAYVLKLTAPSRAAALEIQRRAEAAAQR